MPRARRARTSSRWRLVTLAACLLASIPLPAQNPNGFIQSDQWACLVPLFGNDCTGGGFETMNENWVAPHDIAAENPVLGTVWDDIDFGGDARSFAWRGRGDPTFVDIGLGADPDTVDYNEYCILNGITDDFVMGIAVTYVRNTTGAPLHVGLCTSSDDSAQVWINNSRAFEISVCRGVTADCSEVTPVVLASGINRIATLVWDGYGGFGFRLGFRKPDGGSYTQDDPEIQYLGAGDGAGVVGPQPILERGYPGGDILRPDALLAVTLKGDGTFVAAKAYHVCEEIRGEISPSAIRNVSSGGTASVLAADPPAVGDFRRGVVGIPCAADNFTHYDGAVYTTHAHTGGDIWADGDVFEFAYDYVQGDFELSVEVLAKRFPPAGRWGKFGLMARQSLDPASRYLLLHDQGPDLRDAVRVARRTSHLVVGACDEPATAGTATDPNDGTSLAHPRFLRLTRRRGVIEAWVSNTGGEANLDPEVDANWYRIFADDWTSGPDGLYLGFVYSVHNSSGCEVGEIDWAVTNHSVAVLEPPAGVQICWDAQGAILDGAGLRYETSAPRGTVLEVDGSAGSTKTAGPRLLTFQDPPSGPLGQLDDAHDIGRIGPCTPGSTTVDDRGTPDATDDTYTQTAGGLDIWAAGDQFQFAYKRVQGDFAIQARFTQVLNPPMGGRWGKYGLMARWDASPNAAYFFVHNAGATNSTCEIDGPRTAYRPKSGTDGGNGEPLAYWWQDVFGEEPLDAGCTPLNPDPRQNDLRGDERNMAPYLRMVRRGNMFYGYASDDGDDWRILGAMPWIGAPETILVGVASTSHAACTPMEIGFAELRIEGVPPIERRVDAPELPQGTIVRRSDFEEDAAGSCPAGWICNRWGTLGGFRAQVVDGRLRLGNLRAGNALGRGDDVGTSAFLETPVDPSGAWRVDFDVYFSYDIALAGDNNPPADGLTFCMLGTNRGIEGLGLRLGDRGGGLNYTRIDVSLDEPTVRSKEISQNSLAVEFDIWHNGEVVNDGDGGNVSGWNQAGGAAGTGTGAWHTGLDANATYFSAQRNGQVGVHDDDLPDIYDPAGVHASVLYDRGHVKVWLKPNADPAAQPRVVLDDEIEPLEVNSKEALIGFTASTGGATCIMEVDDVLVRDVLWVEPEVTFRRGDSDADGSINITDGIYVLNFLFLGGPAPPCQESADSNDDGGINITDGIYLLNFLFLGGPAPPLPGSRACGGVPPGSADLGCDSYRSC